MLGIALVVGGERYANILVLLQEFLELMLMLVGWIMRLAPLGIMALLMKLAATQDPALYKGLHPSDKRIRVASFHSKTISATKEIMEACGFSDVESIRPGKFFRRINEQDTKSFDQIYFTKNGNAFEKNLHSLLN